MMCRVCRVVCCGVACMLDWVCGMCVRFVQCVYCVYLSVVDHVYVGSCIQHSSTDLNYYTYPYPYTSILSTHAPLTTPTYSPLPPFQVKVMDLKVHQGPPQIPRQQYTPSIPSAPPSLQCWGMIQGPPWGPLGPPRPHWMLQQHLTHSVHLLYKHHQQHIMVMVMVVQGMVRMLMVPWRSTI